MIKNNKEMVSNNTEMVSNNTEMISNGNEMMSDNTAIMSNGKEMKSDNTAMMSNGNEMMSDNTAIISNDNEMKSNDNEPDRENMEMHHSKTKESAAKCIPQETVIENVQLAQAYVPIQKLCATFSPESALMKGTAFPPLFDNYSREKGSRVIEDE